jgi:maleate isomerase
MDFRKGQRDFTQNAGDALRVKYDFDSPSKTYSNGIVAPNRTRTIVGGLTGRKIRLPDVNSGMPKCLTANGDAGGRVVGWTNEDGTWLDLGDQGYPDHLEFNRKFMVVVPSTNTTVEHDYWRMIFSNPDLQGVGWHSAPILISAPKLATDDDMLEFLKQFRKEIMRTVDVGMTAEPEYLVMGMSLETFFGGWEGNRELMAEIEDRCGLSVATGAEACKYALEAFGKLPDGSNKIKTISIITPYVTIGDLNVIKFFEEIGFKVKDIHGFKCGSATDIAHVPTHACEAVIRRLAKGDAVGSPDAIVQCGTNLSMVQIADQLEPELGLPIIPINAATVWFALRENGFTQPIYNATRLLREF